MLGTSSWRVPSGLVRSIASPRLTCVVLDDGGLAVDLGVAVVHLGHGLEALHHGPADEVRERHLAAATAGEVVVDHDAVVDQELHRDRAHARGGRDGEARLHVGDDPRGGALEDCRLDALDDDPRGGRHGGGDRRRSGRRRLGCDVRLGLHRLRDVVRGDLDVERHLGGLGLGASRGTDRGGRCDEVGTRVLGGDVVGEEVPPGGVDALRVGQVLLVDLVNQPLVRTESCEPGALVRRFRRRHRHPSR